MAYRYPELTQTKAQTHFQKKLYFVSTDKNQEIQKSKRVLEAADSFKLLMTYYRNKSRSL